MKVNIDGLISKIETLVDKHYLGNGEYARYLWQDESGTRKMGVNEYGCADAMNILYTIGRFPVGKMREDCLNALLSLQHADTGLFIEETHTPIHTTAHCIAAIELFDEQPRYPQSALKHYFTKEGLDELLDSLGWTVNPWSESHKGAGIYVIGALTDSADLEWQRYYFKVLSEKCDPEYGMSRAGTLDEDKLPLYYHLYGWFHYTFNYEYARMPQPYPEGLIDTCIMMYDEREKHLDKLFGRQISFPEIDWIYVLNRCTRQTPHRFYEAKDRIRRFAEEYIAYWNSLDFDTDDKLNDLHMLFGGVCALAELQTALPGEIETSKPLRLVLDRRPFI